MTVSASTAYEDSRRALRCAVWQRNGRCIKGTEWITVKPGEDPPDGLGANKQAWTQTLRDAASILRGWKYKLPVPTLADGSKTLDEPLLASVRLLFKSMTQYRPTGLATECEGCGS